MYSPAACCTISVEHELALLMSIEKKFFLLDRVAGLGLRAYNMGLRVSIAMTGIPYYGFYHE